MNISNRELAAETLEEGRNALFELERQLKERNDTVDSASENNSSKQHSSIDRRTMDQLPRLKRLNQRSESLGITVEELDDRGLLNGGGSVPHYYTSIKQKNRRFLELQPRSNRLQERGKEAVSKLLNGFFHMLRVLSKRGLNLEAYYRQRDLDRKGLLPRKHFISSLKQLGLPFNNKELQEIAQHFLQPPGEAVDYLSFLQEGRLYNNKRLVVQNEALMKAPLSLGDYCPVLHQVKRALQDASKSLQKPIDEIYRMFARWDSQGTGTVTATQFLRVLARLHVDLSDQDQDFLVELLDTSAMGRIDFDSLLAFCFAEQLHIHDSLPSPHGMHVFIGGQTQLFDDTAGETLSAVSTEGNNSLELKSTASNTNSNSMPASLNISRRPHTASISRPYALDSLSPVHSNPAISGARPLTASGRVASTPFQARSSSLRLKKEVEEEEILLVDLPDDVIHGEENYLPNAEEQEENGKEAAQEESKTRFELSPSLNAFVDYQALDPPRGDLYASSMAKPDNEESSSDPTDHLVLLAHQILSTLRDIIQARYRRGRSLQEIYRHFDRENKHYFDSNDFILATADLRIETSERVARIAVQQIAIDGIDQVSFGEFKVYILDPDNKLLELNVQEQLASFLEAQGRSYEGLLQDIFFTEDETVNDSRASLKYDQDREQGFVSKSAFVNGLRRIGLVLTVGEVSRLVDRFDINGNDLCSVPRFLRMVQLSAAWRRAETVLAFNDKALEEGKLLRQRQLEFPNQGEKLSEEMIAMSEYLGICVLSEQYMLWIVADALKAPLPVNWIAGRDEEQGRIFFHNRLTGESRWDHPLDPHFRKLRDKYRQSGESEMISPARGFRMKSFMNDASEQDHARFFAVQQNSWQSNLVSERPNIDHFTTPPNFLQERTRTDMTRPHSAVVESSLLSANKATNLHTSTRIDSNSMMKHRPISAPFVKKSNMFDERNFAPVNTANQHTSPVLEATRALTEAIYSSGYCKPPSNIKGPSNGMETQQQVPYSMYAVGGAKPRASSSKQGGRSAVDRALSIGKTPQLNAKADTRHATNRNSKLAAMYDEDILEKLDVAIGKG
eukprot:gene7340-8122_t